MAWYSPLDHSSVTTALHLAASLVFLASWNSQEDQQEEEWWNPRRTAKEFTS